MITVRPAIPTDRDTIVDFQVQMARETEDLALDRPTVSAGAQAVFTDPFKGAYWVAEEDGRIIGSLLALPEWSDWRNGTVLWIHSLYVIPEARRRGVFTALYRTLKQQVEETRDLKGLRLYVEKRNRIAHETYRSLGMTDEHYELYEWLKEG